jgi:hypothetical protein
MRPASTFKRVVCVSALPRPVMMRDSERNMVLEAPALPVELRSIFETEEGAIRNAYGQCFHPAVRTVHRPRYGFPDPPPALVEEFKKYVGADNDTLVRVFVSPASAQGMTNDIGPFFPADNLFGRHCDIVVAYEDQAEGCVSFVSKARPWV